MEEKADLNWKQKIRNTADNADITQSQARHAGSKQHCDVTSSQLVCQLYVIRTTLASIFIPLQLFTFYRPILRCR